MCRILKTNDKIYNCYFHWKHVNDIKFRIKSTLFLLSAIDTVLTCVEFYVTLLQH